MMIGFDIDVDDNVIVVFIFIEVLIVVDGFIDVDMWFNFEGVWIMFYCVIFLIYNGNSFILVDGGLIFVLVFGGLYDLNDLLLVLLFFGVIVVEYIVQLEVSVVVVEVVVVSVDVDVDRVEVVVVVFDMVLLVLYGVVVDMIYIDGGVSGFMFIGGIDNLFVF